MKQFLSSHKSKLILSSLLILLPRFQANLQNCYSNLHTGLFSVRESFAFHRHPKALFLLSCIAKHNFHCSNLFYLQSAFRVSKQYALLKYDLQYTSTPYTTAIGSLLKRDNLALHSLSSIPRINEELAMLRRALPANPHEICDL